MEIAKTRGEIEDAICTGMIRFEQEFMGRGPKHISTHLLGDAMLVRLRDVLTTAERHLVMTRPPEEGRDLVKRVRTKLFEAARPALEKLVETIVDEIPSSIHHHVCTETGEEVVVFSFARPIPYREMGRNH
jgi:uncharacterized protein YbcI